MTLLSVWIRMQSIAATWLNEPTKFRRIVPSPSGRTCRALADAKPVLWTAVFIALSWTAQPAHSQVASPSNPDNIVTTTNPIGTPPGVAADGTNESVNLSNGALTVYVPLLSVPQRGGWSLPFAYIHSSDAYYLQQNLTTTPQQITGDGEVGWYQNSFAYKVQMEHPSATFDINLPRLQASEEYAGDYLFKYASTGDPYAIMGRYCLTNFRFTDWEGNSHPFAITQSCNQPLMANQPFVAATIGDATDGSFYRIDLTTIADIHVISRSGTVYHFYGMYQPFPNPPGNGGDGKYSGGAASNYENWYDERVALMTDTNGNSISVSGNLGGESYNWTVTDTLGRTFTIGPNGLTYTDSANTPQTISFSLANSGDPVADVFGNLSCSYSPLSNGSGPNSPGSCTVVPSPGYTSSQASITYPPAGVNGTARKLQFQLDQRQRITEITYPSGGYTRYDYNDNSVQSWSTTTITHYPMQQVGHKYECYALSSSGICSSEYPTTYLPTVAIGNLGAGAPYNSSITVTDPKGNVSIHTFSPITAQQLAPKETNVSVYTGGTTLLSSQQTVYTTLGSAPVGTDLYFPQTVTTTLNDGSSPVSSTTTYHYANYPAQITPQSNGMTTTTMYIDTPTEIDESDFGGTVKRITTEAWYPLGSFSASSGHILDRLSSKAVTDKVNNLQNSTTYTYDNGSNTVGNLTNKSVTGTNAPTALTQYVVNSYGQVTQISDPNQNLTQISYDDTKAWADTSCVKSASVSGYPSSVTDASGAIITYKYNSCLGTIASVTGPNANQTSSYSYDALQRVVSAQFPDGGMKMACYFDSVPNTITSYTLQAPNSSLPSCSSPTATASGSVTTSVILDGFGRKSETQLVSDLAGATLTSTSYDADGNVSAVSNPYRTTGDTTYGTTTYQYDGRNRKTLVTNPDNTTEQWTYSGNTTLFTDEYQNKWRRTTNAFGDLTSVLEPNGATSTPGMETDYSYDGFNNLLTVTQWGGSNGTSGARSRSFVYDGMSRLRSATNPESGTTGYAYDANGNLVSKTDARSITTAIAYDGLNRAFSKSYTNDPNKTPSVCYQYDTPIGSASDAYPVGRLTLEWTQQGGCPTTGTPARLSPQSTIPSAAITSRAFLSHDAMGRVLGEQQCRPSHCNTTTPYSLTRGYDVAGNITSYTNGIGSAPGMVSVTQTFDAAGRLQTVGGSLNGASLAPLFSAQSTAPAAYAPQGALQNAVYGNNVLTLNRTYDYRLRITGETDTGQGVASSTNGSAAVSIVGVEQGK